MNAVQRIGLIAVCSAIIGITGPAMASPFSRPDQRAQALLDAGKAADAAAVFESPAHRAMALHKSGDVAGAVAIWQASGDAQGEYNLGTTLTQLGDYQRAIDAFDRAASLPNTPAENAHNKAIAEQLLALQQQQSQPNSEGQSDGSSDQSQNAESAQSSADSANQSAPEPGDETRDASP
ncbi:MAG: tetratricopeptide repeat protein, partial [Pseudomonadota bacterium]